ncbi:hypothetical protein OEI98_000203 [Thermoanaerobacter sp. RKWS2]|nr:hypothetical protein [Thermoanaerobacter sp. RKWS2]UZQ83184.1 hypothetical protein OEI98_000203 [Thermoanaerobacter sp. RKWS2]
MLNWLIIKIFQVSWGWVILATAIVAGLIYYFITRNKKAIEQ